MQSKRFLAIFMGRNQADWMTRGGRDRAGQMPELRMSDVGRVGAVRRAIVPLARESR